jgi:hypothetical protein
VVLVAFGEETFKRALKAKLVEVLREELTSGDGNVRALLAQLFLSAVLRDSAGVELSGYLKNLDTALSSRASESTLLAIRDRLPPSLTAGNNFKVAILEDSVGIAREATLSSIADQLSGLIATDYNIISLDLSVDRTDELVASNVIFLKVLESTTPNAQYTIKLFDPSKPGITQNVLPPGSTIERLRRANVYVSNPAQPGARLDLFIFMG